MSVLSRCVDGVYMLSSWLDEVFEGMICECCQAGYMDCVWMVCVCCQAG